MQERDLRNPPQGGRPASGPPAHRLARAALGGLLALLIGLALGGLTDAGQTWLPSTTSSLANSGGSWVLVAFLVALGARGVDGAAVRGTVSLVGLVVGYYVTAALRGVPVAASSVQFWIVAALVIGPLVGLAAGWVRFGAARRAAVGAGVVGGLLIGEAVYGLRYIGPWTSSAYWIAQLVIGLGLMFGLVAWRTERLWAGAVTLVTASAMGAVTVGMYLHG